MHVSVEILSKNLWRTAFISKSSLHCNYWCMFTKLKWFHSFEATVTINAFELSIVKLHGLAYLLIASIKMDPFFMACMEDCYKSHDADTTNRDTHSLISLYVINNLYRSISRSTIAIFICVMMLDSNLIGIKSGALFLLFIGYSYIYIIALCFIIY